MLRVACLGLFEPQKLLIARLGLVRGLPFVVRHAVNALARILIAQANAGVCSADMVPLGEAVPTESRKDHQLDVLHVGARLKVCDELAEGVRLGLDLCRGLHRRFVRRVGRECLEQRLDRAGFSLGVHSKDI